MENTVRTFQATKRSILKSGEVKEYQYTKRYTVKDPTTKPGYVSPENKQKIYVDLDKGVQYKRIMADYGITLYTLHKVINERKQQNIE